MARALAAAIDIDATIGIEHTDWMKPIEVPGTIASFASDKDKAVKEDKQYTGGLDE